MHYKLFRPYKTPLLLACTTLAILASSSAANAALSGFSFTGPTVSPLAPAASEEANITQLIIKMKLRPVSDDSRGREADYIDSKVASFEEVLGVGAQYVRTLGAGAWVVQLPRAETLKSVEILAASLEDFDKDIDYAHPDYLLRAAMVPNDPSYAQQWHYFAPAAGAISGINAPGAWDVTRGAGVTVAVLDTGYTDHPDLLPNLLPGHDFVSRASQSMDGNGRDSDAHDPGQVRSALDSCGNGSGPGGPIEHDGQSSFHGTHVAGTIAAVGNNAQGVTGVAFQSRIVPVRVLGHCGEGDYSDLIDGIRWAAGGTVIGAPANPNPAKVINLSLSGFLECSEEMLAAIEFATQTKGATVVAAAGNANGNATGYTPANCPGVIAVAALRKDGDLAAYSNFGSNIAITAPGGNGELVAADNVFSTNNLGLYAPGAHGFGYMAGTSMAAPHVAGVAALLYALRPNLTPAQVEEYIGVGARPFVPNKRCGPGVCGAGMLDAKRSVEALTAPANIVFNQGLTGAWYEPRTAGQGFALQVDPALSMIFAGWYTYSKDDSGQQRWYTLAGNYLPGDRSKDLPIYQNTGGNFNAPPQTIGVQVGVATLSFQSCSSGTLRYHFNDGRPDRSIPLTRLTPDVYCELIRSGGHPPPVSLATSGINAGLNAPWYAPALGGQGFQIEVMPAVRGLFAAWFTYAPGPAPLDESGQAWYTIEGGYAAGSHDVVGATIHKNTGGIFDGEPETVAQAVGTANLRFTSCTSAMLSYHFTDGRPVPDGAIVLSRLLNSGNCN